MSYQQLVIENLLPQKPRRCNPRVSADLPYEIRGEGAKWLETTASLTAKVIPASYHANKDGAMVPIEFVNNHWYYLEWDDSVQF